MIPPRSKLLLAWLGIALYIATAMLPFRGAVLCFGPAGTVAMEAAAHDICGCCEDGDRESPETMGAWPAAEGTCCTCIDLPLGLGSEGPQLSPTPKSDDAAACLLVVRDIAPDVLADVRARGPRIAWPPPRCAPDLPRIKTVILLV